MQPVTRAYPAAALVLLGLAACQSLPGDEKQQGAVIGGVGGAVAGAALGDSALATVLGGAIGAGGGYLIGAEIEKRNDEARGAVAQAQQDPATAADVRGADDADLNGDGFVTMDEVEAMAQYGLNDREILDRLERTGQVFELTAAQEDRLVEAGVSESVVREMQELNPDARREVGLVDGDTSDVIGERP